MDASNLFAEIVLYFPTTLENNITINVIVNVNDEHSCYPILKKGVYRRSRGRALNKSEDKPPAQCLSVGKFRMLAPPPPHKVVNFRL